MDSSWDGSTAPPPDAPGTCAVQRSDLTLTADILQRIQQEDPALQEAAIQDGYINEGIMAGMDEEAAQEEKKAVDRIVRAFRDYQQSAEWEVARLQYNFRQLPAHHKALLTPQQQDKFTAMRDAIEVNRFFIQSMLMAFDPEAAESPIPPHTGLSGTTQADGTSTSSSCSDRPPVPLIDVDKVRYVLKNLVRDWSSEGAAERAACYDLITAELQRLFTGWSNTHRPPRVLVPGAGLARLCCEIAKLGYEAQGNEFSYFMLLASSFVLNHLEQPDQFTIYPWIHSSCNHITDSHMLRPVTIPDVPPPTLVPGPGLLSMCAGDFAVYRAPDMRGLFDCVVTCFFLDTAHNPLEYLEVISHCLRMGGAWVHIGPLLYHWADAHMYLPDMELSIELSLADIIRCAGQMGFSMQQQNIVDAPYLANILSMHKTVYQAAFWTMIKVAEYDPSTAEAQARRAEQEEEQSRWRQQASEQSRRQAEGRRGVETDDEAVLQTPAAEFADAGEATSAAAPLEDMHA